MANPVVHFEIMGKDADRLRGFYRDAFDWSFGPPIGGGIGTCPSGYEGHVTFYVYVPDIAAALTQIESLGGKKMTDPMDVPGGPTVAMFEDPEGHVIGLVHGVPQ